MTPIWEGVAPFLANLQIWSSTWSGVVFSQAGGVREYGMALDEMPLPLLCRRPMMVRLVRTLRLGWIRKEAIRRKNDGVTVVVTWDDDSARANAP